MIEAVEAWGVQAINRVIMFGQVIVLLEIIVIVSVIQVVEQNVRVAQTVPIIVRAAPGIIAVAVHRVATVAIQQKTVMLMIGVIPMAQDVKREIIIATKMLVYNVSTAIQTEIQTVPVLILVVQLINVLKQEPLMIMIVTGQVLVLLQAKIVLTIVPQVMFVPEEAVLRAVVAPSRALLILVLF